MFVKAWADTTSTQKKHRPSLSPPLQRPINGALHTPRNSLIKYFKSSMEKPPLATGSKSKTIALAFSDHDVRACMAMAQEGSPPNKSPSPFVALAGLFWACISKARGKGENGFVDMSICLDRRRVLQLENDTFGNFMFYNSVEAEGRGESSVLKAIRAVAKAAAEMDDKERIMEFIDWLEHNDNKSGTLNNGSDLMCVSLEESADPYLTLFEGGIAPIRVSYYVEPVGGGGQVLVLRRPPEEGRFSRVVMVTLAEDEAAKLLEDDIILSLHPRVLIGADNKSQRRQ